VPPLLNLAVTSRSGIRSGIGSGIGRSGSGVVAAVIAAVIATIGVSNDNNSVIELCTAIGVLGNNTALVELEGCSAGIEGDGQGLLLNLCLDFRHGIAWRVHVNGLRPISRGDRLCSLMLAFAFLGTGTGSVGVVLVLHDTMISDEIPGGWQEATLATPHTVVLAPFSFIIRVCCQGTIDKTLFRETLWSSIIF